MGSLTGSMAPSRYPNADIMVIRARALGRTDAEVEMWRRLLRERPGMKSEEEAAGMRSLLRGGGDTHSCFVNKLYWKIFSFYSPQPGEG